MENKENKEKRFTRSIPISKLYRQRHKDLVVSGVWKEVLDVPELGGIWLIWGNEKNGKTWFSLKLAEHLSKNYKTLYISAEQGLRKSFKEACLRVKLESNNKKLVFDSYMEVQELKDKLKRRRSADIIFIDNVSVYQDELKYGGLRGLTNEFPYKLFVLVAHEDEKGHPYTATAKMASKLSEVLMHVEGLKCKVYGRVPGGDLIIDELKAKIYHGNKIN
jgi:hypothetical protein